MAGWDAIRVLLLTGARPGDILGTTWAQIELGSGTWTKPTASTKQRREHRASLPAPAIELIRGRPRIGPLNFCRPDGGRADP